MSFKGDSSVTEHLDVGPRVPGGEAVCRAVLEEDMTVATVDRERC